MVFTNVTPRYQKITKNKHYRNSTSFQKNSSSVTVCRDSLKVLHIITWCTLSIFNIVKYIHHYIVTCYQTTKENVGISRMD